MIRKSFLVAALAAALVTCAAPSWAVSDGPSALEAAKLALDPQAGWIGHYLPDDRYKIVGGIWKVVSTETDHYFHTPQCPKMLAQSADNVIGFASAKDAEDAGYAPDPSCGPNDDELGGGAFMPAFTKPRKVVLSDGKSTIVVPAGWSMRPTALTAVFAKLYGNSVKFSVDAFKGPDNSDLQVVKQDYSNDPRFAGVDFGQKATASNFFQFQNSDAGTTGVFGGASAANLFSDVQSVPMGDMTGVRVKVTYPIPGRPTYVYLYMAGRGAKMYLVIAGGNDDRAIKDFANSYRPN